LRRPWGDNAGGRFGDFCAACLFFNTGKNSRGSSKMRKSGLAATANAFTETHPSAIKPITSLCHDPVNFSVFLWHGHCLIKCGR
jgi:hypothetical protein